MSKFIVLTRTDKSFVAINVDKIIEVMDCGNHRLVATCTAVSGRRNYGSLVIETTSEILQKIDNANK